MVSSVLVPVSAELWTTSPNVIGALGVEDESVKPEIQSSALVISGEVVVMYALTTFLCVLCVAVCVSSLPVCVNGDDM